MERLTGLDASFLYLETPQMHMHVAMAAVLDSSEMPGGYSFEKIQDLIRGQVDSLPPFRRRLVEVPFGLHHPLWVDDPNFDIIHHVRRVACPAPGGERQLAGLCGRIASTPLDRARPLWEVWVIEGLEEGRFAVLAKVHHAAVDGASGAGLLVHLFSLQRDGEPMKLPRRADPEHIPEDGELVRYALASRLKQPLQMARLASRTGRALRKVVERRREGSRAGATPMNAPRTPFNGPIGARRSVAFARCSLRELKQVKRSFGTTVNDVVLGVCAGALRRHLEPTGDLPAAPLLAACPISVRGKVKTGEANNKVSVMFTSLATHLEDPVERLRAIQRATRGAKEEHNAVGADMLQNWAEFAAPRTFNMAARMYARLKLAERHRPFHNVVVSNVPGPPVPLYLAGAELVASYPMGPVHEGMGLNITVMSYRDHVDFGFMAAENLLPDPWALAAHVKGAMRELVQAAETFAKDSSGASAKG